MPYRPAAKPLNETMRLHALRALSVLDTPREAAFDDIVLLASAVCEAPVALVSLIDAERQWFKACLGLPVSETHRDLAFCAHAILNPDELLLVPDTLLDERFADSALVKGAPYIRFYAGAPIVSSEGLALGTVCVVDMQPRALSPRQRDALKALARQTATVLQLRAAKAGADARAAELRESVTNALVDDQAEHADLRRATRSASINNLTAGIAHDFNNLLHAVGTNLQLVNRLADKPDDVRKWAGKGIAALDRGARLIARLMVHSRAEPGVAPLDVPVFLGDMRDMLEQTLGGKVPVQFDLQGGGAAVVCDTTQLEAAVLNLAVNARDAMAGSGRIEIATALEDIAGDAELAPGRYLRLTVRDHGPGMPPEVAARAFEPFFTTKEKGKGTGLGLAQVYGFALRAGGTARIGAAEGGGAVVSLWLRTEGQP